MLSSKMGGGVFEYFVVCGVGPEIKTLDGSNGFFGLNYKYDVSLIDQFPSNSKSLCPHLPPELPKCVLPAGIEFHTSGFDENDSSTYPRSYPVVLTVGDGSKLYVSCIAFRDPVDEDIAEAYGIPLDTFADKSISLVSRTPCFRVLCDALKEIFSICFSPTGSQKPLWEVIEATILNVPLPTPGKDRVLFSINNYLLSVEAPPESGLPHADISFQPLVQCLDAHNLIVLFTAVLLERRILLRSDKYSLLTLVSEALCHLIYPFQWQHVYVPILFANGVDFVDAPTPYIIGLHSSVDDLDTSRLLIDGVIIVDIDHNFIITSEEVPAVPEPELSTLHGDIMNLLYPDLVRIDEISVGFGQVYDKRPPAKPWGEGHDLKLRLIFLKFFATLLSGYRNFVGNTTDYPFDAEAFILERSHSTNDLPDAMICQFLGSQGFSNYIGKVLSFEDNTLNALDKSIESTSNGQDLMSIFPSFAKDPVYITIPDPTNGIVDSSVRYMYNKFPANVREEEQMEKRNQILHYVRERNNEEAQLIVDIKVKLKGLWTSLAKLEATDVIVSSDEYETILALIETDSQGLVGSAFIGGIREHMNSGWNCKLSDKLFSAVKELVKEVVIRAFRRNDMRTLRDALEVSAEIYRKDLNGVPDYIQRHLLSLPIWGTTGFWKTFFDYLIQQSSIKPSDKENLILSQLMLVALHMGGLGVPETIAWPVIESLAKMNNIDYEHYVQLRWYLSYVQQLNMMYWGMSDSKVQTSPSFGMKPQQDVIHDSQQPASETAPARGWVRSMFGKEAAVKVNSFRYGNGLAAASETSGAGETGSPRRQNLANAGRNNIQSNVRILRGHSGAITALHSVSKKEVWDLVGDREDSGFFVSGSTDCSIKMWDPSHRGSELLATLKGHTGAVRAICSDRQKIVSGSDDLSILVWDKFKFIPLEELKGHKAPISHVRMLSGERVLSSSHDGTVKMWDARIGSCIATVARYPGAVLCMEYDDSTGILAAAGRNSMVHIWDIRAGKLVHELSGHTKWIRSVRMFGDRVITGSDDWTARVWSISQGRCEAVLTHHAGPVLCVEHSQPDDGIITGSGDGSVRFWENADGDIKCAKEMSFNSSVLSINAGGEWLAIGTADNSMSLFNQPRESICSEGWQLYRTPRASSAVVRCMASNIERKQICSGGRDGLLRMWDATISI